MTDAPTGFPPGADGAPDPEEFETFWHTWYLRLRHHVGAKYGRHDDPDEIVQETMKRSCVKWADLDERPAWGWLCTVAGNVAIDRARARERADALAAEAANSLPLLPPVPQPDEVVLRKELCRDVHRALKALPKRDRMVLQKFHFEDVPTAQIADLIGMKDNAVRQLLKRARQRFEVEYRRIADSTLAAFLPVIAWARRWVQRAGAVPVSVSAAGSACCLSLVLSIGGSAMFGGLHDLLSRDRRRAGDGATIALDLAATTEDSTPDLRGAVPVGRLVTPTVRATTVPTVNSPTPPQRAVDPIVVGPATIKTSGTPSGSSSQEVDLSLPGSEEPVHASNTIARPPAESVCVIVGVSGLSCEPVA